MTPGPLWYPRHHFTPTLTHTHTIDSIGADPNPLQTTPPSSAEIRGTSSEASYASSKSSVGASPMRLGSSLLHPVAVASPIIQVPSFRFGKTRGRGRMLVQQCPSFQTFAFAWLNRFHPPPPLQRLPDSVPSLHHFFQTPAKIPSLLDTGHAHILRHAAPDLGLPSPQKNHHPSSRPGARQRVEHPERL